MATLASVLCLFTIQALVLINTADAGLQVVANPTQIEFGTTPTLDINCTFTAEFCLGLSESTFIKLSRRSYSGDVTKTVAVIYDTDRIDTNETGVSVTGVLNLAGESFLNVRWENLTVLQVGEYSCEVIASGYRDSMDVHVNGDVLSYFLETIERVKQNVHTMENSLSDLAETVQNLALGPIKENIIGSYQDTDYFLSKEQVGRFYFSDNLDVCKSYGGQLLEINDQNEDTAIKGFLGAVSGVDWVQVGGTDKASEGNWVFPSTNQPMSYTNWMSNRPTSDTTKNCLWLSGDNSWQMYDSVCDYDTAQSSWRYMCEIPRL